MGRKEENETVSAKRRCVDCVSTEAFDIFKGRSGRVVVVFLGVTCWRILSDCEPETWTDVTAVLVVTDVLVSPSSVVTECCEGVSLDSAWRIC